MRKYVQTWALVYIQHFGLLANMQKERGHIAIVSLLVLAWLSMDILWQYQQLHLLSKHLQEYHTHAHPIQPWETLFLPSDHIDSSLQRHLASHIPILPPLSTTTLHRHDAPLHMAWLAHPLSSKALYLLCALPTSMVENRRHASPVFYERSGNYPLYQPTLHCTNHLVSLSPYTPIRAALVR